jgi:tRNA modification GTPase
MSGASRDTIFALSSGALPAGIAVVRVSGPDARQALENIARKLPEPRRAVSATLMARGEMLDRALILWLPGPATATGEDIAEFHLHGGRAVVAAVSAVLAELPGLRPAEPGEFTRRAFSNGKLDLTQAEGLADLLAAETEAQRRQALRQAEGGLGRLVGGWRDQLLGLAARVEAAIEFAEDEDDVPALAAGDLDHMAGLAGEMEAALQRPPAERLRDGVRIVVAGPTNAGKSSLINILAGREAAIASPVAGTTRDLIEVPLSIADMPCLLIDSAGLRDTGGHVEQLGMARARAAIEAADLILWLGPPDRCPNRDRAILVRTKADLGKKESGAVDVATSILTGEGLSTLRALLETRVRALLPPADAIGLNARHRERVGEAVAELLAAREQEDALFVAEHLRLARLALDRITGRAGVEDMLDALFGRFCIGK